MQFLPTSGHPRLSIFSDHEAINCDKVVNVEARRKVLVDKLMCFNCSGIGHRAGECKS